jgi:hypothetical protein
MKRAMAMDAALLVAGLSLLASPSVAQTRDVQRPAIGTASISGVVVSDSPTPTPLRRVVVQLTDISGARSALAAITDDRGRFGFADLPAGNYTLVATRAAYVSSAYGAKAHGRGSGVPISLAAGQAIPDITLKMIRGGVIAGVLRDSSGQPAAGAGIILMLSKNENGRSRLIPIAQDGQVNARGEYRIYGLIPGDYIVRAQPPARYGKPDLHSPEGRSVAYAPTYYPGTNDAATASLVTVGAGEERLGIDFAFRLTPTATISGRIALPGGQAPKSPWARLELQASPTTNFIDRMIGVATTGGFGDAAFRVDADGKVSVPGVPPGRYLLKVSGSPAGGSGLSMVAAQEVVVNGQDVSDVDVVLYEGQKVSGTIVFDGEDPQAPLDASRATISITSNEGEATSAIDLMMSSLSGSTTARGKKDRTFAVVGLMPGTYRMAAMPPGVTNPFGLPAGALTASPDGWTFKSAMAGDRDLADGSFVIRPGEDLSGVVVTFSKSATSISGHLIDAAGQPAPGYPIVVFSTTPSDWGAGSRRVVSAKPLSDGAYKITGLPPGEYYLCAVGDLDVNDLYDPSFLEQLAAASFKLILADGEKKVQDLKIGGGV